MTVKRASQAYPFFLSIKTSLPETTTQLARRVHGGQKYLTSIIFVGMTLNTSEYHGVLLVLKRPHPYPPDYSEESI